jgi:hypothetical protein
MPTALPEHSYIGSCLDLRCYIGSCLDLRWRSRYLKQFLHIACKIHVSLITLHANDVSCLQVYTFSSLWSNLAFIDWMRLCYLIGSTQTILCDRSVIYSVRQSWIGNCKTELCCIFYFHLTGYRIRLQPAVQTLSSSQIYASLFLVCLS